MACAGAKRLVPEPWRKWPLFDNIFRLRGVPVITVQLRYDGWITEMQDRSRMQDLSQVSQDPSLGQPGICALGKAGCCNLCPLLQFLLTLIHV